MHLKAVRHPRHDQPGDEQKANVSCLQVAAHEAHLIGADASLKTLRTTDRMIVLLTLVIALACMAFAVHQWWRGYHLIAVGFIAFALVMAGIAIEGAKDNQNAEGTEVLRQQ